MTSSILIKSTLKDRMNLPNFLTLLRFFAAPVFALCFIFLPRTIAEWAALFVFVIASLSDFVDGYLARRWGQISRFGAMLDPIADKALVIVIFLVLAGLYRLEPFILLPIIIIVLREIFVSGLREFVGSEDIFVPVSVAAKYKTMTQFVAVAFLLIEIILLDYLGNPYLFVPEPSPEMFLKTGMKENPAGLSNLVQWAYWIGWGGIIMLWISALLSVLTGWRYFKNVRTFVMGSDSKNV